MFKRYAVAFLLILSIIFCSSCNATIENVTENAALENETAAITEEESKKNFSFTLLYCNNDSFNPYSAITETNRSLGLLLFDSLVKIDNDFNVKYSLAKKITNEDNKVFTIKLKNARFSNGTSVTAEDIIYSIKLAKKSKTKYKKQLAKISSYTQVDSQTVKITLKSASPYFERMLDFPIIRTDTANKSDASHAEFPPIGSGRYILDLENKQITYNKYFHSGKPEIKTIALLCAPDSESADHYIEMGGVSLVYNDLADGKISTMNGNLSRVKLNNLVYLGTNRNKDSVCSNEYIRYCIAAGIDRSAIIKQAYYSYGSVAIGPYRSDWKPVASYQNLLETQNNDVSIANLEKIGYNDRNADGFFVNENGDVLTLSLIYNKENDSRKATAELIKNQLSLVGIKVVIHPLSWKEYQKALKNNEFDLYLAEITVANDMDITPIISNKSSICYGKVKSKKLNSSAESYQKFLKGDCSLADFINAFYDEMPFIPVCYRDGIVICSKNLTSIPESSYSDIFYGIEDIALK